MGFFDFLPASLNLTPSKRKHLTVTKDETAENVPKVKKEIVLMNSAEDEMSAMSVVSSLSTKVSNLGRKKVAADRIKIDKGEDSNLCSFRKVEGKSKEGKMDAIDLISPENCVTKQKKKRRSRIVKSRITPLEGEDLSVLFSNISPIVEKDSQDSMSSGLTNFTVSNLQIEISPVKASTPTKNNVKVLKAKEAEDDIVIGPSQPQDQPIDHMSACEETMMEVNAVLEEQNSSDSGTSKKELAKSAVIVEPTQHDDSLSALFSQNSSTNPPKVLVDEPSISFGLYANNQSLQSSVNDRWNHFLQLYIRRNFTKRVMLRKLPSYLNEAAESLNGYLAKCLREKLSSSVLVRIKASKDSKDDIVIDSVVQTLKKKHRESLIKIEIDGSSHQTPETAFRVLFRELNVASNEKAAKALSEIKKQVKTQKKDLNEIQSLSGTGGVSKLQGAFRAHVKLLFEFMEEAGKEQTLLIVVKHLDDFLNAYQMNQLFLYTLMDMAFNSTNNKRRIIVLGICFGMPVLEKRIKSRFDKKHIFIERLRSKDTPKFMMEKLLVEDNEKLSMFSEKIKNWNKSIEEDLDTFASVQNLKDNGFQAGFVSEVCLLALHNMFCRIHSEQEPKLVDNDFKAAIERLLPKPLKCLFNLSSLQISLLLTSVQVVCVKNVTEFNFEMLYFFYDEQSSKRQITKNKYGKGILLKSFKSLTDDGVFVESVAREKHTAHLIKSPNLQWHQLRVSKGDVLDWAKQNCNSFETYLQEWFLDIMSKATVF